MDVDYVELWGYLALMWVGGFTVSFKVLSFKKLSEVL